MSDSAKLILILLAVFLFLLYVLNEKESSSGLFLGLSSWEKKMREKAKEQKKRPDSGDAYLQQLALDQKLRG